MKGRGTAVKLVDHGCRFVELRQDWVADPLISFDCEALKGPLAVELLPAKVGIRTLLVGNLKRSYCRLRDLMG